MKFFKSASKRAVCVMLAILMTTAGLSVAYAAEPGDSIIKGTFTMSTFDGTDPGEQTYYYSDNYFTGSGKVSDAHLKTMSAALIFQVRGSSATPVETFGATLKNIGFNDITAYDLDHTSLDSLGMLLAHKTVDGKEVVAVVIRGDDYEHEMAANLVSGTEGDIKAFAEAEALAESRVLSYIEQYGIDSAKYWVTGYSRSGAVGNLFGRELNKDPEKFRTTEDDIYVYTFEAANGSTDSTVYENIHSTINRNDFITYLYPSVWGIYSNGTPEYIGNADERITIKILDVFSSTFMGDYTEVEASAYLDDMFSFLSKYLSRETYNEKVGIPLSKLLNVFYNMNDLQKEESIAYFKQVLNELRNDDEFLLTVFSVLAAPSDSESLDKLMELVIKYLIMVADGIGNPFDELTFETLKSSLRSILEAVAPVVAADMVAQYEKGEELEGAPLYHIMTIVGNIKQIVGYHYNYNVFNELKKLDSFYEDETRSNLMGDVDLDGKITIDDATHIQKAAAGLITLTDLQKKLADVSGDGNVTIADATCVQKYLAQYDSGIGSTGTTVA